MASSETDLLRIIGLIIAGALVMIAGPRAARADGIDYSATEGARSLPLAGAVWGVVGYDAAIWGEKKAADDFLYGYLRPSALLATSAVVNRAEASFDVFPISFFGVTFALSETLKLFGTSGMDCDSNLCTGFLRRESIRPSLALGYASWFLAAITKWERENVGTSRSFVDEYDVLVGAGGGDQLVSTDIWLGRKIGEEWSVGAHWGDARMIVAGDSNDMEDAFLQRKWDKWSGVVGVGTYRSDYQARGLTAYFQLKWAGAPSLGFF